jgi:hypothetical protein
VRGDYTHSFFGRFSRLSETQREYELEGYFSPKGEHKVRIGAPRGLVEIPSQLFEGVLGMRESVLLPCRANLFIYESKRRFLLSPDMHTQYLLTGKVDAYEEPMLGSSFLKGSKVPEALLAGVFLEGGECRGTWENLRSKPLSQILAELGTAYKG